MAGLSMPFDKPGLVEIIENLIQKTIYLVVFW